jgi:N-acetyl-anhydromuramyl-L-alanine amidase AmpD
VWQDFRDGCASTAARLASPIWPTGAPYGTRASIREVFDHPSGATWAPAGDLNDPHAYLATMLRLMNDYTDQDDEWIAATKAPTPPVYQDYLQINYTRGRNGHIVKALVLHVTQGESAAGCINWFKNPTSKVSAHYVVDRDGDIYATVREKDVAWANGILETPNMTIPIVAEWATEGTNPNSESIGVEMAGYSSQQPAGQPPELVGYTEAQFDALAFLLPELSRRHNVAIAPDWTFGHNEISGYQRRNCPGLSQEEWDRVYAAAPPVQGDPANATFDRWCEAHGDTIVWRGDYTEHAHWAGVDPAPLARTAGDVLLVSDGQSAWAVTGYSLDEWETTAQAAGQLLIYRDEGG